MTAVSITLSAINKENRYGKRKENRRSQTGI